MRTSRGVTIVELLVSLAIAAMLLTATAVAVDASFKAYSVNQLTSDLQQRARVALHRMVSEIRSSTAHEPVSPSARSLFASGVEADDNGIVLFRPDGEELRFFHDAQNQLLIARLDGIDRTLLEGVTNFRVTLTPMYSYVGGNIRRRVAVLQRASLLLTVRNVRTSADVNEQTAPVSVTLSSAVMPRQNSW
jgi:prepilin-type N-terminal cleavage/methylation domain-containing protein